MLRVAAVGQALAGHRADSAWRVSDRASVTARTPRVVGGRFHRRRCRCRCIFSSVLPGERACACRVDCGARSVRLKFEIVSAVLFLDGASFASVTRWTTSSGDVHWCQSVNLNDARLVLTVCQWVHAHRATVPHARYI